MTVKPHSKHLAAVLLLALNGCVYDSTIVHYPREWQSADGVLIGDCPDLGGSYADNGDKYIESGVACASPDHAESLHLWNCSLSLPENLAGHSATADSWEVRQPGDNVLILTPVDHSGARGAAIELVRKTNFDCVAGALVTHRGGSMLGGPAATAVGVAFLSGGHSSLDRSFTRNTAGELVMQIRESSKMYHLVVGGAAKGTSYVRWFPTAPATGATP